MATTLGQLAQMVGGVLRGESDMEIHGAACLETASPGHITLSDSAVRFERLKLSSASAVVAPLGAEGLPKPSIRVEDVHQAFATIVTHYRPVRKTQRIGVSPHAFVSVTARLGDDVDIHTGVTIGEDVVIGRGTTIYPGVHILDGCQIGEDVTIMPGAVLYQETRVGDRAIIHARAVLGAYGFGYQFVDGQHQLSAQLGNVVVESDVEIGAGTTIDRGTYGATVIGEGTKIDNLVMVAHNCRIGRHNMICSQVGIAGSSTTGDYVVMAGQVGVRDHVRIGHRVVIGAKGGVTNDVADDERMIGIPATPEREQKLKQAALSKLPEMRKQLKALERSFERFAAERESSKNDEAA